LPFALADINGVAPAGKHHSWMNVISDFGSNNTLSGNAD
jgi:hypothetical protein